MRRKVSPFALVLLGFGTFLLVLAPLLTWYVTPRAAVTPIGLDTTAVYTGTGSVFDTTKLKAVPGQRITVTQHVRGDVADSERSGDAVWDVALAVDTGTPPSASIDPHTALDFTSERWVTDRRTNQPVHCCHEQPYHEGDAYLKFPFDVRKQSYQWWDSTLHSTVTVRYGGTRKVQGYTGYLFTGRAEPARTGTRLVPGTLVGRPAAGQVAAEEWYSDHGIELVVDQRTGRVLYAQLGPRRTLRAPGSTKDAVVLLDSRKIAFTAATQKQQVKLAKRESGLLRLTGRTLPVGAAVAGAVLAMAGAVWVVRGRRDDPRTPGSSEASLTM